MVVVAAPWTLKHNVLYISTLHGFYCFLLFFRHKITRSEDRPKNPSSVGPRSGPTAKMYQYISRLRPQHQAWLLSLLHGRWNIIRFGICLKHCWKKYKCFTWFAFTYKKVGMLGTVKNTDINIRKEKSVLFLGCRRWYRLWGRSLAGAPSSVVVSSRLHRFLWNSKVY